METEFAILNFIQNYLRTPVGDGLMIFISALGNLGIIWIVLGLALLVGKKHRKTGVLLLAALGIEALLCNMWLKPAVAAPRPCDLNTAVELLIPRPGDYSFPSGHTGASFAAVCALYLGKERYWYLGLILAILMAFSRMYLYVHFPSDILGGMILGIASGFLAYGCGRLLSKIYSSQPS